VLGRNYPHIAQTSGGYRGIALVSMEISLKNAYLIPLTSGLMGDTLLSGRWI